MSLRQFVFAEPPKRKANASNASDQRPAKRFNERYPPKYDIFTACNHNDLEAVEWHLDHGVNINHVNHSGNTPLYVACYHGQIDTVRFLLDRGAAVNEPVMERDGKAHLISKPLYTACEWGHAKIVQLLLERGASIEGRLYMSTPLMIAYKEGHIEVVRLLLKAGADPNSLLMIACKEGRIEVVRLLLKAGADPNRLSFDNNNSLLFYASEYGRGEVVRLLLSVPDININHRNQKGETALWIACENDKNEVVGLLLDAGADPNKAKRGNFTPLYTACERQNADIVRLLLDASADPDEANDSGFTPLMMACTKKAPRIVRLLLDANADVNKIGDLGKMALSYAAECNDMDSLNALLEVMTPISINHKSSSGRTALYVACFNGYDSIVRKLLETGANPNLREIHGETPLYAALLKEKNSTRYPDLFARFANIVDMLIDDARSVELTLFCVCRYDFTAFLLRRLMEVPGINLNARDHTGLTPLMVATLNHNLRIVEVLMTDRRVEYHSTASFTALQLANALHNEALETSIRHRTRARQIEDRRRLALTLSRSNIPKDIIRYRMGPFLHHDKHSKLKF